MKLTAPVTTLALLLSTTTAGAVDWHGGDDVRFPGTAADAADAFLQKQRGTMGPPIDLIHRNTLTLPSRYHTVRLTQQHAGLPVLGSAVAVVVAPDGSIALATFDVHRHLSVSATPSLRPEDAEALATGRHGARHVHARAVHRELAIYPHEGGKLVWVVDVPSDDGGWRYLIDANDGRLVHERPVAAHALGRVYRISSAVTPTPEDLELTDLLPSTPTYLTGWDGNLKVVNYVSGDPNGQGEPLVLEQTVEPNVGEDFLYDPPADVTDATDPFAQVNLFYHLTRSRDFFRDTLAVDSSSPSWSVVAAANVQSSGQPFDNAFFSPMGIGAPWNAPNFIGIGQGAVDFAYDSDVFIHEFGHYVSHNAVGYNQGQLATSEWGLSPWGGGIDEGISDYFACTVNGDSTLGEASLANLGGSRELTDTTKVCPDDIVGQVHADGEIIGSMSWSIREELGAEATDQLVWGAVSMLTPTTSLGDYARAIQASAQMLEGTVLTSDDLATIDAIIAERGMDDCDQELALTADEPITTQMIGLDLLGQAFGADCGTVQAFGLELPSYFHFRVTPDAGDEAVRFIVDYGSPTGDLKWNIYVRAGEHVGMEAGAGPVPIPTAAVYDYAVNDLTTPTGEIVIDQFSDPPFDPNTTYHMVIGQQNCPNVTALVSTSAIPGEEPGQGGAGGEGGMGGEGGNPADAVVVDGGCGCEVAGSSSSRAWWAALAVALAAARRRKRRDR